MRWTPAKVTRVVHLFVGASRWGLSPMVADVVSRTPLVTTQMFTSIAIGYQEIQRVAVFPTWLPAAG